jgi:hypothetical protein
MRLGRAERGAVVSNGTVRPDRRRRLAGRAARLATRPVPWREGASPRERGGRSCGASHRSGGTTQRAGSASTSVARCGLAPEIVLDPLRAAGSAAHSPGIAVRRPGARALRSGVRASRSGGTTPSESGRTRQPSAGHFSLARPASFGRSPQVAHDVSRETDPATTSPTVRPLVPRVRHRRWARGPRKEPVAAWPGWRDTRTHKLAWSPAPPLGRTLCAAESACAHHTAVPVPNIETQRGDRHGLAARREPPDSQAAPPLRSGSPTPAAHSLVDDQRAERGRCRSRDPIDRSAWWRRFRTVHQYRAVSRRPTPHCVNSTARQPMRLRDRRRGPPADRGGRLLPRRARLVGPLRSSSIAASRSHHHLGDRPSRLPRAADVGRGAADPE